MDNASLRTLFHGALDEITPAKPWLGDSVRDTLRRNRPLSRSRRMRRSPSPAARRLVAAALVLIVAGAAAVATIAIRERAQPVLPVKQPPPITGPVGVSCQNWSPLASLQHGPVPEKMTSPTSGWAQGDLRTDDGGRTWHDVTPSSFRSDVPVFGAYPPGYADFFLDDAHVWLARPYFSSRECFDHVTVFSTTNGGRSWRQASIPMTLSGDTHLQMALDFIDAQHGWMTVIGSAAVHADEFLYATHDGGQSWQFAGQLPDSAILCPLQFSSPTTGWAGGCGDFSSGGTSLQLTVTRDGGLTWSVQPLPNPPGGCDCSEPIDLTFVNASTGAFLVDGYTGVFLYMTTDGGLTWRVDRAFPGSSLQAAKLDFEDAQHLWALVYDPTDSFGKGAPIVLYQSSDLGAHWRVVQRNVALELPGTSLQFVDPTHGFFVQPDPNGQASQVLVTGDGGHSWTLIHGEVR